MKPISILLLLTVAFGFCPTARATTWYVPYQCPTIQAGIDSASAGDTVLVACGTYYEHDILMKSGVCLRSETGDVACVTIDAEGAGRVLYCENLDATSSVKGLWLTGGDGESGGGAFSWNSSLAFDNCVFHGNHSEGLGGGLACYQSSPFLSRCVFSQNVAGGDIPGGSPGGGMSCENGSAPILTDCVFVKNSGYSCGGVSSVNSSPMFNGCIFRGNIGAYYGGAIGCLGPSSVVLQNCTLSGNEAFFGAGIAIWSGTMVLLENTIVAFHGRDGYPVQCCDGTGGATLACCDVYGNEGGDWEDCIAEQYGLNGNFSACPLFCDLENGNFHLQECSPCTPGHHPDGDDCGLIGAFDVGCECGLPSRVQTATWSSVKALYR